MYQTHKTPGVRRILEDAQVFEAAELECGAEGADEGGRVEARCAARGEGGYEMQGGEEGGLKGLGEGEGGEGVGDPGGFCGAFDVFDVGGGCCCWWGGVVAEGGGVVDYYFLVRGPEGVGDYLGVVRYYAISAEGPDYGCSWGTDIFVVYMFFHHRRWSIYCALRGSHRPRHASFLWLRVRCMWRRL